MACCFRTAPKKISRKRLEKSIFLTGNGIPVPSAQ